MVTVYSEGPWQAGRIGCKNPMKINKGKSEAPPLHRNNPRHQGKLRDAQLQQKRSRWLGGQMWASSVSLWPRRVAAPQAANRPGEMMFLFCSALLLHIWKAGSSSGLTGTRNAGLCKKLCMDGNIWRARGSSGNRKFHVSIRSWKKKKLNKKPTKQKLQKRKPTHHNPQTFLWQWSSSGTRCSQAVSWSDIQSLTWGGTEQPARAEQGVGLDSLQRSCSTSALVW